MTKWKNGTIRGIGPKRRKRLLRLEEMYLRGNTNLHRLGAAFGVSYVTIHHDLKVISKEWLKQDTKTVLKKRKTSVKRVEDVYREARLGFDRSRQDSQEIHYRERIEQCVSCRGTGKYKADESSDEWCEVCKGEGEVSVGVTTTVRKGQAGDSSFLRVAHSCLVEMNRLEGLHKDERQTEKTSIISGQVIHAHLGSGSDRYLNASMESIIEVKTALAKLLQEAAKSAGKIETIDGKVIGRKEVDDACNTH